MMEISLIILGAILAIFASWVSNNHISKIALQTERRRVKREKLEQLALLLNSVDEWLNLSGDNLFSIPVKSLSSSPLDMIDVLGELYFPELDVMIRAYHLETMEVVSTMYSEAERRFEKHKETGDLIPHKPEEFGSYVEKNVAARKVMLKKKSELKREIAKLSKGIQRV